MESLPSQLQLQRPGQISPKPCLSGVSLPIPQARALPEAESTNKQDLTGDAQRMATPSSTPVPGIVQSEAMAPIPTQGFVVKWPPRHLLLSLFAASTEKNAADLEKSTKRKLELLYPRSAQDEWARLADDQGLRVPQRQALRNALVSLDAACMCWSRDQHRGNPEVVLRQLTFDSSGVGGEELMGIREVSCKPRPNSSPLVSMRTLPLQCLGTGHTTTVCKAAALAHAVSLVAGPHIEDMKAYTFSIYTVTTDLGVEADAVEVPDALQHYVTEGSAEIDLRSHMFPNALRVPDWSHIWDWLLQSVTEHLPFFREIDGQVKAIARVLTHKGHTDALVAALSGLPAEEAKAHSSALRGYTATFAKWRWGTLHRVVGQLRKAMGSLRVAWGRKQLQLKEGEATKKIQSALSSEEFDTRLDILFLFTSFTEGERRWGLGCNCHEPQVREAAQRSSTFTCPMKSMRGPQVWQRITSAKRDFIAKIEDELQKPNLLGKVALCDMVRRAADRLVALIDVKLGFANQQPWTIWRLRQEPAIGTQLIQAYDRHIAALGNGHIHRITARFCNPAGTLRRHVEERLGG